MPPRKSKATQAKKSPTRKPARAAAPSPKQAEFIVLSCMDYRHMDDVVRAVESIAHGADRYDHLVLPGASLGAQLEGKLHWTQTFLDHVEIAMALHRDVHTLLIIEHEDCGAYRHFLSDDADDTHREFATALGEFVAENYGLRVMYRIMRVRSADQAVWQAEELAPDLSAPPPRRARRASGGTSRSRSAPRR